MGKNASAGRGYWTIAVSALMGALVACSNGGIGEGAAGELRQAQTLSPLVPVANVDLEGAAQPQNDPNGRANACDQILTNGGRTFPLVLDGSTCSTPDRPYVTTNPSFVYSGVRGLQMTLPPRLTGNGPDRSELVVHQAGDEVAYGVGFNFDNPKYFGFAMKVYGGSLPLAGHGVHIMQAWQYACGRSETAGNCGVPFVTTLQNAPAGSPQPLQFYVRVHHNGAYGADADTVTGPGNQEAWLLSANEWHRFIYYLHPNSNEMPGTGVVTIWLDGVQIADWHGDWGCNINPPFDDQSAIYGYPAFLSDNWHLRVGMYRTDPGVINQRLDILFDNVRVASSKKQADPAAW